MSKQEFLISLSRLLATLPKEESDKAISYFSELIDDKIESGESEFDAVAELGDIDTLANTIISEYNDNMNDSDSSSKIRYVAEIASFDVSDIGNINISVHNRSIEILPIEGNTMTISYYTVDYDSIKCSKSDSSIDIIGEFKVRSIFFNMFNIMTVKYCKVKIGLPRCYTGNLKLETSNGKIDISCNALLNDVRFKTSNGTIIMKDTNASSLDLHTNNGRIELGYVNIKTDITAKTFNSKITVERSNAFGVVTLKTTCGSIDIDSLRCNRLSSTTNNGGISLNEVTASSISATSSNGRISVDNILSDKIELNTSNSGISGYIVGNEADYNIFTSTCNGSVKPLPSSGLCIDKTITAKTSNGRIHLQFK